MKGLFDFDGNGETDALEFLVGAGLLDPSSPMNKGNDTDGNSGFDTDYDNDDEEDDYDCE